MSQVRSNTGFWKGFWTPFQALRLVLTSPQLLSLVAIPLALNICLYMLFFHYGAHFFSQWIDSSLSSMVDHAPHWATHLGLVAFSRVILRLLSWLILALVAAITFTFVSGIVSAPFNDLLSKATMRIYRKDRTHHGEIRLGLGKTIRLEAKRMTVLLIGAIGAALIGLVPLMQVPALMIGALLVAFEYFGYPISQRSSRLSSVAFFMLKNPLTSLGFGSFLLLVMALPFTSIVYIPLAVVSGTMLYADHEASLR